MKVYSTFVSSGCHKKDSGLVAGEKKKQRIIFWNLFNFNDLPSISENYIWIINSMQRQKNDLKMTT